MKFLPYFKWFPADAETDETYGGMTDSQLGFYHRCLNRSWINDGLPADLDELARNMHVTRKYLDSMWVMVGRCWKEENGRLRNPRQEEEREQARSKSAKASDAVRTRYGRRTNASPRAYESVSESVSDSVIPIKEPANTKLREFPTPTVDQFIPPPTSENFERVWNRWPRKTGRDAAYMDWLSVVTPENESAVMACVDRYLGSREVAEGKVRNLGCTMEKPGWLIDCGRDKWACEWPKARDSPPAKRSDFVANVERVIGERISRGEAPW